MRFRSLLTSSLTAAAVMLTSLAVPATATAHPSVETAAAHPSVATVDRADAASGWLARQLVDGDHFEADFGGQKFPDQGLTIDAILAFAATKSSGLNSAKAAAWLARPEILSGYAGDGATESYAGATAKLTLAAEVRGTNPATFGGVNLPARLRALITPSGRVSDKSAFGDFSNAISQSLAIIALKRTPGGVPAFVVNYTIGTRCADGGFPVFFDSPPCVGDTDATAFVAQALLATHRYAEANRALAWLASKQQPSGGLSNFSGDAATAPNTNTTGVAAQAFRAGGRLVNALRARTFVLGLQQGCSAPVADRGAIAFDATGFDTATATRATPQAVFALAGPSLTNLTAKGSTPAARTLRC